MNILLHPFLVRRKNQRAFLQARKYLPYVPFVPNEYSQILSYIKILDINEKLLSHGCNIVHDNCQIHKRALCFRY